jgi:dihydroneopterin aldolase
MTIHIEELTVDVIIGILDFERTSKQKVIVEAKINYTYTEKQFIDYTIIIKIVENMLKEKKYRLLEEALNDIGDNIIVNFPQIISLYIKISKPNIITNASVALSKEWK